MKTLVLSFTYSLVMRNLLKIFSGISYRNREVLRNTGQFILVANHNSHLDTIALMSALPSSKLKLTHPVAAGDYFGKSQVKSTLSKLFINALLIPRSRPKEGEEGPDPIQMMIDMLDQGHSLILFPEGSRGEPEKLQKFKRGIGILLAQRPHIPFIPVYLKGMGRMMPKGDPVPVPFNGYAVFGAPVYCQARDVDGIVEEVEKSILELAESGPNDH